MNKYLSISKSALLNNLDYYSKTSNKEVIPVVKDNAYGHGLKEIVSILEKTDVKMYAVSSFEQANELKEYTKRDILILNSIEEYDDLNPQFIVSVISKKQLKRIIDLDLPIRIHLKINIALKRKGVSIEEVDECLELIKNSKLKLEGIYTHYSSSKLKEIKKEFSQFKLVIDKLENKKIMIHASSSVSSLLLKENVTNAIRVGIGLYGFNRINEEMEKLIPVSELKCCSKNIYPIKCFDRFGYDNRYYGKKGYLVVCDIGYGDGLFYQSKVKGYLESGYLKEVGIRNMDNLFFYSPSYVMENSEIEIFGKNNSLDKFAKDNNLSVYRVLALLNPKLIRQIVD